ncbi:hypothetical protein A0J61_11002 [Choanephora cucurbitarum]|uniref:Uncharacterized protein n=1 Tax=Choanephora cucurbitarum TaxID=101091 RepID=A0A1C7MWY2_9FUNG|nr:hypothetical protein A0J61_11002 [Choanephora cucurbitarum]
MVIEFLNDHLSKNCSQEQQQQHKIDSLETAIKKLCTNKVSPFAGEGLSDQIQADKDEDERFVRNLSKKLNSVESAISRAKPEHLALLQREQLRLLAVRKQAETHLSTPIMLCIADEAFTDGGKNNLQEEVEEEVEEEEEDEEEDEEEVVDDEEENNSEEKLALFVEAIEQ